jgi:Cys-tRNA(Pro)/Cys-tRNA(Cys) deacylase
LSPEIYSFLAAAEVTFKVHDHSPIVSFSDAKSVLPFDPGSMVKGLAFKLPNQAYAIVGMRAADRADYKKIADALGIRRADLKAAEPRGPGSNPPYDTGRRCPATHQWCLGRL